MFARAAKFCDIVRAYHVDVFVPANSNDNHQRPAAGAKDRPVLRCSWRANPTTGRLECQWRTEGANAPPSIMRKTGGGLPRAAGGGRVP
jgi:hypothetical protein